MPAPHHDTNEEAAVSPRKLRRRTWASVAGAVVMVASALVLTSATAAQGADPAQVCSDDRPEGAQAYTRVANSAPIPGGGGTVYLFYEGTTGYNCAVTINNGGGATYMDVGLRQSGNNGTATWDHSPNYSEYAGPVYVSAKGICVDFTGAVGDQSVTVTNTNCDS